MTNKKRYRHKRYSNRVNSSYTESEMQIMSDSQGNKKRQRSDMAGSEDALSPSARASASKKAPQLTGWDDNPSDRLRSASWGAKTQSSSGAPAANLRSSTSLSQIITNQGKVQSDLQSDLDTSSPEKLMPEYMRGPHQNVQIHHQNKAEQSKGAEGGQKTGNEDNKTPPPPPGKEISLSDVMSKLEKLEGLSSMEHKIDAMAEDMKLLHDIKGTTAEMRQDLTEVQGKVKFLEDKIVALEGKAEEDEQNQSTSGQRNSGLKNTHSSPEFSQD